MATTVTVRDDRLTVDLLAWRHAGQQIEGLVEQVLALNPGLAASTYIPPGTVVTLPDVTPALVTPQRDVVQLYD